MREIKFRGKSIQGFGNNDIGTWYYGGIITVPGKEEAHIAVFDEDMLSWRNVPVDPKTVGQYTGLKDRNVVDIYEGDILKIILDQSYVDKPFYTGVVTYRADNGYPAFDLEPWIDCDMNALSWLKSESDPSVVSYEVIGNRFDNPELLEEVRE